MRTRGALDWRKEAAQPRRYVRMELALSPEDKQAIDQLKVGSPKFSETEA